MPLKGFESLCAKNAHQIISKDRKNPQYHKAVNKENNDVTPVSYTHLTLPTTPYV